MNINPILYATYKTLALKWAENDLAALRSSLRALQSGLLAGPATRDSLRLTSSARELKFLFFMGPTLVTDLRLTSSPRVVFLMYHNLIKDFVLIKYLLSTSKQCFPNRSLKEITSLQNPLFRDRISPLITLEVMFENSIFLDVS